MNIKEEENLRLAIKHIFESGANETRVFEMVKRFINLRLKSRIIGYEPDCHFYDEEKGKWIWAYSTELINNL